MNYYDIKITGKDVKRFIHNLYKMHIEFLNIEFLDKSVIVKVNERDYKKILNIKTIYEIEIVKVYGIAFLKQFFKNYFIFFVMLILGFVMFFSLTNIIFEVEVVHNNPDIRNLVLEELEKAGIKKFNLVVSYKEKEKIKEDILKNNKDKIEWLEIDRQGTKYIVNVEERKLNNVKEDETPRNIIAKKSGVIKKIVSSKGEIITKKDQYVKKGDVLIGGIIHNKEEEVARVRAEGSVFAETWYTVTVELPYHYYEEKETDNSQTVLSINWFNKNIKLFDFKKYNTSKLENIFKLKNALLPISISLSKEKETKVIDKIYTKDNAINEASLIAQTKLKSSLGENINIIYEKNLKISEEDSKIIVVMFYKIYEDITSYQEIALTNNEEKIEESR